MESQEDAARSLLGYIAEVQALRAALSKFEPNHPLLTNRSLRQRLHAAGAKAFGVEGAEDQARRAGAAARY
jgi:hypothetical protein